MPACTRPPAVPLLTDGSGLGIPRVHTAVYLFVYRPPVCQHPQSACLLACQFVPGEGGFEAGPAACSAWLLSSRCVAGCFSSEYAAASTCTCILSVPLHVFKRRAHMYGVDLHATCISATLCKRSLAPPPVTQRCMDTRKRTTSVISISPVCSLAALTHAFFARPVPRHTTGVACHACSLSRVVGFDFLRLGAHAPCPLVFML